MSSLSISSPLQRAIFVEQGAFHKEKIDKPKSFSEKPFKFFYSVSLVVKAVFAGITALALIILAKIASIFKLKTLENYCKAYLCPLINTCSRAYAATFNYNELMAFSANTAPFQSKLYKSDVDANKVLKEIYIEDFNEIEKRAKHLNAELEKDKTERCYNYSLEPNLRLNKGLFKHAGYCFGASLDFAERYFEEISRGTDEEEAILKVCSLCRDQVTSRAVILQTLDLEYSFLNTYSELDKANLKLFNMRYWVYTRKLKDLISQVKSEPSSDTYKKIDKVLESLIQHDIKQFQQQNLLPISKLAGLKCSKTTKHIILSKPALNVKKHEFFENRKKQTKELLNSLQNGVYYMNTSSPANRYDEVGHAMLLFKLKSGDFIFFDPNFGIFKFKSDQAAEKLLKTHEFWRNSNRFIGQKRRSKPKFTIATFTKLDPSPIEVAK